MKKIQLLGELGKKFGKSFSMDVKNPAEAIRALCSNFPEFREHLINSEKRGIAYKVLVGKEAQSVDDLHNPSGKQNIKIVPILQGAGGGFGQVVLGALLVAAAFIPGVNVAIMASGGLTYSGLLIGVGVGMALGGVAQLLTPTPDLSADYSNNQPDNKPSYVFNGGVNTTAQGYPVPVGYGRMIVGSAVISAGIVAEELA